MVVAPEPSLHPVASYVSAVKPYIPGKPIEELERELGLTNIMKLASNENPLGPSPKVTKILSDPHEWIRLYPDASHHYLRQDLAVHLQIDPEEVAVGNGSNEILDLLVRTFCVPGDNIVTCAAAFIAYRLSAMIHGVDYRDHEPREDLVADLDAMAAACDERTKIIFLPNPNNPTGTYVTETQLDPFLEKMTKKGIVVVLDSAYVEYVTAADYVNPMEMYRKYPNIVVTRTFSKAYGLAGIRVGYGIAHPTIISLLMRVKMPFNVNSLGLVAARTALEDEAHLKHCVSLNTEGMGFLEKEFDRLGVRYWPSQGNFILVDLAQDVAGINQSLLEKGVIVRPVAGFGLKTHLRITIGSTEENQRMVESLEFVLKG